MNKRELQKMQTARVQEVEALRHKQELALERQRLAEISGELQQYQQKASKRQAAHQKSMREHEAAQQAHQEALLSLKQHSRLAMRREALEHRELARASRHAHDRKMLNLKNSDRLVAEIHAKQMNRYRQLDREAFLEHREKLFWMRSSRSSGAGRGGRGGGGRGGDHSAGIFGGFAFGPRYGYYTQLSNAGVLGRGLGAASLAGELGLGALGLLLRGAGTAALLGGAGSIAGAGWLKESVGFNQVANNILTARTGGDQELASQLGRYLRRTVGRETPFTARETLLMTPKFMSMGRNFSQSDFMTQMASDVAFGLNPNDTTRAAHLTEKLFGDILSKGRMYQEEARQAANLGIPMHMFRQNVFKLWNSEEFQKRNPTAGKLRSPDEVVRKISEGQVGVNMSINALAETVKERLGKSVIGEYSQWATTNTLPGLFSQFEGLSVELGDIVASSGAAPGMLIGLLRDTLQQAGSVKSVAYAGFTIDSILTDVMRFGTGFVAEFKGLTFLNDIAAGFGAINWQELGGFSANLLQDFGGAFKGFMTGLELARPELQSLFGDLVGQFKDPTRTVAAVKGLIELIKQLAELGNLVVSLGATTGEVYSATSGSVVAGAKSLLDRPLSSTAAAAGSLWKGGAWGMEYLGRSAYALGASAFGSERTAEAAKEAAMQAEAAFKGYWEIRSPSKRMQRIGRQIAAGYSEGLADLPQATENMARTGARAALSGGSEVSPEMRPNLTLNIYQHEEDTISFAQRVVSVIAQELHYG